MVLPDITAKDFCQPIDSYPVINAYIKDWNTSVHTHLSCNFVRQLLWLISAEHWPSLASHCAKIVFPFCAMPLAHSQ